MEDTLPIGLDGRGTFRVLSIEVRVHEVNDFKIYNGFEFSSKKVVLSRSLVDGRESGERGERGRKGEGRGKEGGRKEQWKSKLGMKLNHHFLDL